jgi:hypothetical protein
VLVLAGVLAVLTAGLFVRTLPLDVLTVRGDDGDGVLASVPVPGSGEVDLEEGPYTVYLAYPSSESPRATSVRDAMTVGGPDGEPLGLRPAAVSGNVAMGDTAASTLTGFEVTAAATYRISAPDAGGATGARLLVVPDTGFGAFFGGVMGTVVGVFAALGVGAVGLGLTVAGAIVWHRRSRAVPPGQA